VLVGHLVHHGDRPLRENTDGRVDDVDTVDA
jgi:hypothetical protein